MMNNGIFISIKPKYTSKIELGEKNYEFRNYLPKRKFEILYVYETFPTCSLKYIIKVDKIIKYPNKIEEEGFGNIDFNKGLKKSRYAYHISSVEKINNPIPLKKLSSQFGFSAPQAFAYDTRYYELVKYIKTLDTCIIVNNK